MPHFSKKSKIVCILLAVILLLGIAAGTAMERSSLTFLEKGLRELFAPIQNGAMVVYQRLSLIPQFFTGVNELLDENSELQRQVANLNSQLSQLQEAEIENVYLRELLDLSREMQDWQPVAASVIGRSTDTWYNTITIKGGTNKGFAKDMPVITTEGLVGRILSVSQSTSEVLLITDKESAVGAMIQISYIPGVVEGASSADRVTMLHIPYDARVVKDQTVVTSGLGGIYPRGLRIGYITAITPTNGDLMLKANVHPFVDFERLDNVLVLTHQPETIVVTPPQEEENDG